MKQVLTCLLILLFGSAKSQFLERIYLTDSTTIYTGWVIEQVPQNFLKMLRLKERDTIQIAAGKIWKITRVIDTVATDKIHQAKNALIAQKPAIKKNDIYLEVGGAGLFSSLNYERQLTKDPGLGVKIGAGFYTEKAFYLTVPVGLVYLFPIKNSKAFIDAGFNVTWARIDALLFGDDKNSNGSHFVSFIPSLGYRKHTDKNTMWRVQISPVINNKAFVPWMGFCIGKRF